MSIKPETIAKALEVGGELPSETFQLGMWCCGRSCGSACDSPPERQAFVGFIRKYPADWHKRILSYRGEPETYDQAAINEIEDFYGIKGKKGGKRLNVRPSSDEGIYVLDVDFLRRNFHTLPGFLEFTDRYGDDWPNHVWRHKYPDADWVKDEGGVQAIQCRADADEAQNVVLGGKDELYLIPGTCCYGCGMCSDAPEQRRLHDFVHRHPDNWPQRLLEKANFSLDEIERVNKIRAIRQRRLRLEKERKETNIPIGQASDGETFRLDQEYYIWKTHRGTLMRFVANHPDDWHERLVKREYVDWNWCKDIKDRVLPWYKENRDIFENNNAQKKVEPTFELRDTSKEFYKRRCADNNDVREIQDLLEFAIRYPDDWDNRLVKRVTIINSKDDLPTREWDCKVELKEIAQVNKIAKRLHLSQGASSNRSI